MPDVIKRVPDRLQGLSGKTIVFDGTLITQRLHFAQLPHPYRHVLGWYRIIQELKNNGVDAICVFDGKERSTAKAKESLRRKEAQRLANARQVIERERLNRLVQLQGVLGKVDWNNLDSRKGLSERFKSATPPKPRVPEGTYLEDLDLLATEGAIYDSTWYDTIPDASPAITSSAYTVGGLPYALPDQLMEEEAIVASLTEDYDPTRGGATIRELPATGNAKPFSFDPQDSQAHFPVEEHDLISLLENTHVTPRTESPDRPLPATSQPTLKKSPQEPPAFPASEEDLPQTLVSLYHDYRNSIPKVTSVSRASRGMSSTDTEVESVEYEMSKTQHQLTKDEGDFWKAFTASPSEGDSDDSSSPSSLLATLRNKSFLLSESYKRSAHPPTSQHYAEVKEIIRSMGVPCVDVKGAFEAEAVASSIVLNGLADFVASEDTDVLVYGAPLVRNISNRREPLTFVSGANIQATLQLSREMFIDFALLLGTDFTRRIKNVGPARALKFIRTHGTIEKIVESETKYPPTIPLDEYFKQLERVEADQTKTNFLMGKYGLASELEDYWEHALEGNYFDDNPKNSDVAATGF